MRLYEGLFIIDNAIANSDWDTAVKQVHKILENRGAEILKSEKWGERKLAYKMKGHKRGTYMLVYFNAPSDSITPIKRDLQLSDNVIRTLIVKIEKIKEPTSTETKGTDGTKGTEEAKGTEEKTEEVPEEKPEPVVS